MSALRFRDDIGRFAEENDCMNSMLKNLAGCGQPEPKASTPDPDNTGQPVPPGAGPDLPEESENDVMNRAFMEMIGITNPKSR